MAGFSWNRSGDASRVIPTASKANPLERRRICFAAAILSLSSSSKLPTTAPGRPIAGQMLRSGTAAAADYGEARGAESRADFIPKLKVVFRELHETTISVQWGGHGTSDIGHLGRRGTADPSPELFMPHPPVEFR
jgi:four helix bundle protein